MGGDHHAQDDSFGAPARHLRARSRAGLTGDEIIVTGSRREADDYDASIPAIGLRRTADYAIQEVAVIGDTRETEKRREEIFQMVRGAIELAAKRPGIELATGEMVVEPLTLANYRNLPLATDGRPDTDRATFPGEGRGAVWHLARWTPAFAGEHYRAEAVRSLIAPNSEPAFHRGQSRPKARSRPMS